MGLVSLTITDKDGEERCITDGVVTWYKCVTTLEDYLCGHPLKLFGNLALAQSICGKQRNGTLKSVFAKSHGKVSQVFNMMIHNCFTEKGFNIPGGVLTSLSYADEIVIARPNGESAINVGLINGKFAEWINNEVGDIPLRGLQNDVYQYVHLERGECERGRNICQLVTALYLLEGTFSGERDYSYVNERYKWIFGEMFPEELPSDLELRYNRDEILELCYKLRNSLKKLCVPNEIDLRFENNDFVFEIPGQQSQSSELVIYAENFYNRLVTHIRDWEVNNRNNPDYMPNRIETSFEFEKWASPFNAVRAAPHPPPQLPHPPPSQ